MKRLFSFLILVFAVIAVSAAPRSRSQAQAIAQKMAGRIGFAVSSTTEPDLVSSAKAKTSITAAEPAEAYYVFSNGEDKGFIIVSGEDKLPAIVGYTDNGTFDTENMPVQLKEFLSAYVALVDSVQSGKLTLSDNVSGGDGLGNASVSPVEPLLGKIEWNQSAPFNNQTLTISNVHTVTGCGPTAVSQVMRYWKYPTALPKDIPGYTYNLSYVNGQISIPNITKSSVEEENAYDWDNMLEQYSSSYTQNQAAAVAKLMNHVGHAMKAEYGLSVYNGINYGGTSTTYEAMKDAFSFFGYDESLLQLLYKQNFSYSEWKTMLTNEMRHGRPVVYGGQAGNSGHAFVLDGIDANGLYHVNWGWSGSCNGYFDVTILNPNDNSGIGASTSTDGYNGYAMMVVGITKNKTEGETKYPESGTAPTTDTSVLTSTLTDKDGGTTLLRNSKYNVCNKLTLSVTNPTSNEFDGSTKIVKSSSSSTTAGETLYLYVPANSTATFDIPVEVDSTSTYENYYVTVLGTKYTFTVSAVEDPLLYVSRITSNASEDNLTPIEFDLIEGTPTLMLPTLTSDTIKYYVTIGNDGGYYRGSDIVAGYLNSAHTGFSGSSTLMEIPTRGTTTLTFTKPNQVIGNYTGIELWSSNSKVPLYYTNDSRQFLPIPNSEYGYYLPYAYFAYIAGQETNVSVTSANLASNDNAYYSSLYLNYAVRLPEGVEAYTAIIDRANNAVTLHKIESGIVPKNTGVILRMENKANYELTPCSTSETVSSDLQGKLVDTPVMELTSTPYVLSIYNGSPAFQKYSGTTLRANKAYLILPSQAKSFSFSFDDATAINTCTSKPEAPASQYYYNLQGQRVSKDAKGIIIVNGKKIINK